MVSKKVFKEVPKTVKDWETACKKASVQKMSINSFVGMHSGSEITQGQYLLMRVLYPKERRIREFRPATYNLTQEFQAAMVSLNASTDFQAFLLAIRPNSVLPHTNLGVFTVPRMNQLLIQPTAPQPAPTSRNVRPRATAGAAAAAAATPGQPQQHDIDEEVVNVHMITFLQALTSTIPNVSSEWTPRRFPFQTHFAKDKYEAQTDGYLRVQDTTGKVQAIVEVKREPRRRNSPDLEMQEAAEMVGWIMDNKHQPNPSLVGR